MSILRQHSRKTYVSISNQLAQDSSLSFEARGLLLYLLSKPDDWQCSTGDVEREGNIGKDQRRRIMLECERAGYITFEQFRSPQGRFNTVFSVRETPAPEAERTQSWLTGAGKRNMEADDWLPDIGKADTRFSDTRFSDTRFSGTLQKTDLQKTDLQKTDLQKTEEERGNAPLLPARGSDLSTKSDKEKTSNHPTIQAVRRLLKRYPNSVTHPAIIEAIGDNLDNAKLEQCAVQWALRGFNLLNFGWIYDWYVNGIPADKRAVENAAKINEKEERRRFIVEERKRLEAQGLL